MVEIESWGAEAMGSDSEVCTPESQSNVMSKDITLANPAKATIAGKENGWSSSEVMPRVWEGDDDQERRW